LQIFDASFEQFDFGILFGELLAQGLVGADQFQRFRGGHKGRSRAQHLAKARVERGWPFLKRVKKTGSKQSFQVNEAEADWGGFLIDEDTRAALSFFKRAVRATARDDRGIVAEAWDQSRTIVTSNRRHFLCDIQDYQRRANKKACRDLWALVVVPNLQLDREKGLSSIQRGLDVPPIGTLRWRAVGFLNLYVRLTTEGNVEIHRFERCPFCSHPKRGIKIKHPWNDWYNSLGIVRAIS
jgi:hypothetical protein